MGSNLPLHLWHVSGVDEADDSCRINVELRGDVVLKAVGHRQLQHRIRIRSSTSA